MGMFPQRQTAFLTADMTRSVFCCMLRTYLEYHHDHYYLSRLTALPYFRFGMHYGTCSLNGRVMVSDILIYIWKRYSFKTLIHSYQSHECLPLLDNRFRDKPIIKYANNIIHQIILAT
jgi:hypothetical protein